MKIKSTSYDPIDDDDGWWVSQVSDSDCTPIEKKALALQEAALSKGFYCICSNYEDGEYHMFLVPANGVRYVIEKFGVGSHAGSEPASVYEEIAAADAKNPMVPFFADEAGLKARFSKPVTKALLAILEDSLYSVEAMMDDGYKSVDDYIQKNQGVHLWWD